MAYALDCLKYVESRINPGRFIFIKGVRLECAVQDEILAVNLLDGAARLGPKLALVSEPHE